MQRCTCNWCTRVCEQHYHSHMQVQGEAHTSAVTRTHMCEGHTRCVSRNSYAHILLWPIRRVTLLRNTVQFISKLTPTCTEHACVLQFLSSDMRMKHMWHATGRMRAIFHVLHVSDIRVLHTSGETARKSDFVCCMRVTFLVCCTWVIVELIPWSMYLVWAGYELQNG